MTDGTWYRVPMKVLRDTALNASDIGVFAVIADKCNDGTCEISHSQIAELLHVSSSTVKRSVRKLRELGYISAQPTAGGRNVYRQFVLPAKRRTQSKRSSERAELDVSKYQCLINNFEEPGKEVG